MQVKKKLGEKSESQIIFSDAYIFFILKIYQYSLIITTYYFISRIHTIIFA